MEEIEEGVVIGLEEKEASVRICRHSECSNCGMCPGQDAIVVNAYNDVGAGLGERVALQPQASHVLKASFLVFAIPVIMMIGGSLLGFLMYSAVHCYKAQLVTAGGILFFAASVFVVKHSDNSPHIKGDIPRIIKILN